jgi:hypothetical protein
MLKSEPIESGQWYWKVVHGLVIQGSSLYSLQLPVFGRFMRGVPDLSRRPLVGLSKLLRVIRATPAVFQSTETTSASAAH